MTVGSYLWLGLAGLLLALLGTAFAYLTLRRRLGPAHPLYATLRRFDRWLAGKAPRVRRVLRRRLSLREWHGLALSAAAVLLFGLLWGFAVITEGWSDQEDLYQLDQAVHSGLDGVLSNTTIQFFRVVTHFGGGFVVFPIALGVGLLLAYWNDWWRLTALCVVVGLGQGVLFALKWAFSRGRPGGMLAPAGPYSFPSGHSFSAMVLYGFLIFLTWRYARREATRLITTIGLTLLVALVGLSRVVLSVHWVSDVLGGFTLGLAWLVCGLIATRALQAAYMRQGRTI